MAQDPNLTLAGHIDRFIVDSGLAHDFVRGDENLDVVGEDGTYPSLAKLVKESRLAVQTVIADLDGFKVRQYSFGPAISVIINHELGVSPAFMRIVNTAGQELNGVPTNPIDENSFELIFSEPESGTVTAQFFPGLAVIPAQ